MLTKYTLQFCFLASHIFGVVDTGLFDISELRNVNYELEIERTPFELDFDKDLEGYDEDGLEKLRSKILKQIPKPDDVEYTVLTSKNGQQFACRMPSHRSPIDDSDDVVQSYNPKYLSELVSAGFYLKACIDKDMGWWTYEVCKGKVVRQRHGAKNEADQIENSLGIFTGRYNMPEYSYSTTDALMYVEEVFDSGTKCDLPDKVVPRKSTIRYECDPLLATSEAYIYEVDEFKSCEYLITVKVGSLCTLKEFVPPGQRNAKPIVCKPYLSEPAAMKYVEKLVQKQKDLVESKKRAKRLTDEIRRIERIQAAILRTETYLTPYEERAEIRRILSVQLIKAKMESLLSAFEVATSLVRTPKIAELFTRVAKQGSSDQSAYISAYVDYFDEMDEDRGNFWYYMHDRLWDKRYFPKTLRHVWVQNGYAEAMVIGEVSRDPIPVLTSFDADYPDVSYINWNWTELLDMKLLHKELLSRVPKWAIKGLGGSKLFNYEQAISVAMRFSDRDDKSVPIMGGYWKYLVAEFVTHVHDELDNMSGSMLLKELMDSMNSEVEQLDYFFLALQKINEMNVLFPKEEREKKRVQEYHAFQLHMLSVHLRRAVQFVYNGYKPPTYDREKLDMMADKMAIEKRKADRLAWARQIDKDFNEYSNSLLPRNFEDAKYRLYPDTFSDAIKRGIQFITDRMHRRMEEILKEAIADMELEFYIRKMNRDEHKRLEARDLYENAVIKVGGAPGVENVLTLTSELGDAKELLEELSAYDGEGSLKIETMAVIPGEDMEDLMKEAKNVLESGIPLEELFSEELNELKGVMKARRRKEAYEAVVDKEEED